MSKIEVEHRGLLTLDKFKELKSFFEKNGKALEIKKRFTFVYNSSKSSVREVKEEVIDIKLRITNKKPELAVKYGKWSGKDARREFNFFLDEDQFPEMLEFLKILGYKKFVLMANTKYDYLYNGIEFSLVEVPEWGYYFEAEIVTDEESAAEADKLLDSEIKKFKLHVLDEEEYYDLLDELNNRDGFRIDLDKVDFPRIQQHFAEYF